jgi:stage II sporulation protein D
MRALALAAATLALARPATADETSTADKLRILYSSRFTFTDDGLPLITVEIVERARQLTLSSPGGLTVLPDGDGGSSPPLVDGATTWTVRATDVTAPPRSASGRWSSGSAPTTPPASRTALATWHGHGYEPRAFELGTLFAVDGEVIDTREVLIAIDPVDPAPAPPGPRRPAPSTASPTSGPRASWSGGRAARVVATERRRDDPQPIGAVVPAPRADDTDHRRRRADQRRRLAARHRREDRRYWGAVYVTLGSDGKLTAVNAVAEDKLLAGLVPAEIFADAPEPPRSTPRPSRPAPSCCRRSATAALTDPYLLCSTQQCQVYAGAGKEDPRTTRGVTKTRGVVLLRDGGGLVDARYSASAGGHTEDNDAIWGGAPDPSLRGKVDTKRPRRAQPSASR